MIKVGIAAVAGIGAGFYAGSSSRREPQYQSLDYGETLAEALQGQIDLAPEMYRAESDPVFGRPAYAKLEQTIAMDGLLGRELEVDSEGYTNTYAAASVPEDGFAINNETEKWWKYLEDNKDALAWMVLNAPYASMKDGTAVVPNEGYPWLADINFDSKTSLALAAKKYHEEIGKADGKQVLDIGVYDSDGNKVSGEVTRTYVGIDKAGTKIREGGGIVDLITGGQVITETDADGNTVERKMGFDADGNFLGLNALQQDIDSSNQKAKIVQELELIREHGQDFTEAYRSQGDIKKALEDIKYLTRNESAIPSSKIDSGGTALFDYATEGTKPTGAAAEEMSGGANPNSLSEKTKPKQLDKVQKLYSERLGVIDAEYNYLIEQGLSKEKADEWKAEQIAIHKERAKSAGYDEFGNPLLAKDETVIESTSPVEEVTSVESAQPAMASTPDGQLTEGVREIGYGDAPEKVTTTEGFEKVSTDADFSKVTADQTNVDITTDFDARDVDVDFKGDYTARDVTAESLGNMSGLRTSLLDEAKDELELGGDLSEREIRAATQLARQSRTAMGRGRDTGAILEELRLNQKLSNERKLQRQSFATMVAGQEGKFREIETGQQLQAGISNQNKDLQINQQFLTEQGQRLTQGMANQNKDLTLNQQTTAGENLALQQDTDNANRKLQADTTNVQTEKDEFAFKQTGEKINLDTAQREKDRLVEVAQGNQQAFLAYEGRKMAADAANQSAEMQLEMADRGEEQAEKDRLLQKKAMELDALNKDLDRQVQVDIANQTFEQTGLAQDFNRAVTRLQVEQSTSADPSMAVTGRSSGAEGVNVTGAYSLAASANQTPVMYNPSTGASFIAAQSADKNSFAASLFGANAERDAGIANMFGNVISAGIGLYGKSKYATKTV